MDRTGFNEFACNGFTSENALTFLFSYNHKVLE